MKKDWTILLNFVVMRTVIGLINYPYYPLL